MVDRKLAWARAFYDNMCNELVRQGIFTTIDMAQDYFIFYDNLNDEGPAIVKDGGEFEMLGVEVCVDRDKGRYITIPEPPGDFYMEPVNNELMRPYPVD